MWMRGRLVAGGLLGTVVLAAHLYAHATLPQHWDATQNEIIGEIAAWGAGMPTNPPTVCGIGYWTHYPLLTAYVGFAAQRLGIPVGAAIAAGVALAAALLVVVLTWRRSVQAGLVVSLALLASLYYAPGYAAWLDFVLDCSWVFAVVYLIGAAGVLRRPLWPMAVAVLLASWVTVTGAFICAGMVAGVLVAAHGFGRVTLCTGLVALAAFVAGFLLHLGQVWCHFGWDWSQVVADYMTGTAPEGAQLGLKTSALFRFGNLPLTVRPAFAVEWIANYWSELVANRITTSTMAPYWACMLAVFALVPRTGRSLLGAAIMVAGAASTALILPGFLPPHLHVLPRYLLTVVLGALICLAAGVAESAPPDSPPAAQPGAGPQRFPGSD